MRFIDVERPGGPDVLVLREGVRPEPTWGEVLVRVAAAGVNRPDIMQREGRYPPPPGASPVLGLEVAGTVEALGEGACRFGRGDPVCALTNGGGYAEYVSVPESQCLPVPKGLSLEEAAALPETCFTVWSNVFDRAGLKEGETFLVHGGAGGIGTTAIQMGDIFGARVFTTVGGDEKCRICEKLGADMAVDYRSKDFVDVFRNATKGRGVDVILDMVGGGYIQKNIRLAAVDGRIVNIAYLQGSCVEVDFMQVMIKRLILTGSTLRARSREDKARIASALESRLWPFVEEGRFRPIIAARFPLAEAAEAHRLMESREHVGKIILVVREKA